MSILSNQKNNLNFSFKGIFDSEEYTKITEQLINGLNGFQLGLQDELNSFRGALSEGFFENKIEFFFDRIDDVLLSYKDVKRDIDAIMGDSEKNYNQVLNSFFEGLNVLFGNDKNRVKSDWENQLAAILAGLSTAIKNIKDNFEQESKTYLKNVGEISSEVVKNFYKDVSEKEKEKYKDQGGDLEGDIKYFSKLIETGLINTHDNLGNIIDSSEQLVNGLSSLMSGKFSDAAKSFYQIISSSWNTMSTMTINTIAAVANINDFTKDGIKNVVGTIGDGINSVVGTGMGVFKVAESIFKGDMAGVIDGAKEAVTSYWSFIFDNMVTKPMQQAQKNADNVKKRHEELEEGKNLTASLHLLLASLSKDQNDLLSQKENSGAFEKGIKNLVGDFNKEKKGEFFEYSKNSGFKFLGTDQFEEGAMKAEFQNRLDKFFIGYIKSVIEPANPNAVDEYLTKEKEEKNQKKIKFEDNLEVESLLEKYSTGDKNVDSKIKNVIEKYVGEKKLKTNEIKQAFATSYQPELEKIFGEGAIPDTDFLLGQSRITDEMFSEPSKITKEVLAGILSLGDKIQITDEGKNILNEKMNDLSDGLVEEITSIKSGEHLESESFQVKNKNNFNDDAKQDAEDKKNFLTIEYEYQELRLGLMEDGFDKELEMMDIQRKRKLGELDADREIYKGAHEEYQRLIIERSKHAEGSEEFNQYNEMLEPYEAYNNEYVRLTNLRNISVEESDKKRQDAETQNEKKRTEQLASYRNQIGMLQAQLSESATDDILAESKMSLYELNQEQMEAANQARADYSRDEKKLQEVLTEQAIFYDLKRANHKKKSEQQMIEALKKDRTAQFEADTKASEQAIKLEERRLKEIEKQNKAIQQGIDKKEKERKQALKQFDAEDKGVFASLVQSVDYNAALQQGLKDIHNPDGVESSTYSKESIQDAIKERIALMELENENQYKLEQIGQGDYLQRKQDISALQARSADEALKDTNLSSRQRLELEQMKADAYVGFQDAYRQAIDGRFNTEIERLQLSIEANNVHAEIIQGNISKHQEQIDALRLTYEDDLLAIENKMTSLLSSNEGWITSVENVKKGVEGPLQDIINLYDRVKNSINGATGAASVPLGSSGSSGGSPSSAATSSGGAAVVSEKSTYKPYGPAPAGTVTSNYNPYGDAPKLATGGVVPGGYPNDTYPALLTSGEAVLPAWFTNLLASAYQTMPGLSGLVDNSRKVQITLQGIFNEPGVVKREIMQALQQANYSAAGVNGTYYMNTGLN